MAVREGRQRFYMTQAMGGKHKSGRELTLKDFMPPEPKKRAKEDWRDQLEAARAHVIKSQQLRAMQGKVVSEDQLKGLL